MSKGERKIRSMMTGESRMTGGGKVDSFIYIYLRVEGRGKERGL
jgi:hypothetical protein